MNRLHIINILGVFALTTLLSSCLPHRLTEIESEQRNVEVWSSENSSIKVSGNLRFSHPPNTWHNRAGWVTFRIRVISPDRKFTLESKDVNINWHCSYSDLIIPVPIEENTLSDSLLKESNRNRFSITGIVPMEIPERMFEVDGPGYGEYEIELPEFIYENDTLSLPPLWFYRKGRALFLIHS